MARSLGDEFEVVLNDASVVKTTRAALLKAHPAHPGIPRDSGGIGLFPHTARSEYRNFRVREATPAASAGTVDLLPLIDLNRDAVVGKFTLAGGLQPDGQFENPRIYLPVETVPAEYDLHFEVERKTPGGMAFMMGILWRGSQCSVVADGFSKPPAWGLELINGANVKANGTYQPGERITFGKRHDVVVRVRKDGVTALCDGATVVSWKGAADRLTTHSMWDVPKKDRLFLGFQGPYAVHAARLTPFIGNAREQAMLDGVDQRRTAEWVISRGGTLELTYDSRTLASVDELPAGPLQIKYIAFKKPLSGTDVDVAGLGALPEMVSISLDMTRVTPAGLARLERCPKLERLSLGGFPITDEALKAASRFPKLVGLFLSKSDVSHRHCVAIAESFPNLRNLNLMNNGQLDDAAIAPLSRLKRLTSLQLQQTKVTAAGVATLKRAMPNCNIEWDGSN